MTKKSSGELIEYIDELKKIRRVWQWAYSNAESKIHDLSEEIHRNEELLNSTGESTG
ncbi:hypothetical protein SAMN06297229_0239 [Pseudidiomarina planktonica]|uniref:Uncharacterized protein n=1 Tax=Pseudidiomarina planktonica TaxID=1323738 RepID=A0A1Y6EF76_9GAMM|nr:hypothetical protein [Pseudidiomarina planktonica]SMQ59262.1 hypothetical protein SAMN06297229_0239 [Pseudidiomarina planktonica]